MSYPLTHLGPSKFNHSPSSSAEAEYDRLRGLARDEHSKAQSLSSRSQQAYQSGDGGSAHELSEESKKHYRRQEDYNRQASEFIFRENNAEGRVAGDTIDLHGQFVEEAEQILEDRIRYAKSTGQTHLHVIVGKGNHSVNHIQKLKPRVEQVCREEGLQYATEDNAGRIYVNLTGGPAHMPPMHGGGGGGGGGGQHHHGGGHGGQTGYPASHQQQQHHGGGHQNQQNDEVEQVVKKALPKIFRALRGCCTVM
ncbi:DUF1771-domain-containing protein [Aulographum hederae CBS 113979]|uniref:DUF1771-domain-containing protein n=1 Tax=Aulographum hederae CBS 113979 TaxID=1176131 RepID=A0A6G1H073_9PEZI|nr:DUF1771-domain-containing protein [Aulographum hederae CBS 113979]